MKKNKGFTLFELMIVVAIIGVFASLVVPIYQDRDKGRAEYQEEVSQPTKQTTNPVFVRD